MLGEDKNLKPELATGKWKQIYNFLNHLTEETRGGYDLVPKLTLLQDPEDGWEVGGLMGFFVPLPNVATSNSPLFFLFFPFSLFGDFNCLFEGG